MTILTLPTPILVTAASLRRAAVALHGIRRGLRVRSTLNPSMTYRVTAAGPLRATLVAEGVGYFRCYASPSILRPI